MSDESGGFHYKPVPREELEMIAAASRDFARMLRSHFDAFIEMGFSDGEAFELTRLRAIATMQPNGGDD